VQDPIEIKLSELTLRKAPADWKETILNRSTQIPCRNPIAWNRLAFAAAWTLIGLLLYSSGWKGPVHEGVMVRSKPDESSSFWSLPFPEWNITTYVTAGTLLISSGSFQGTSGTLMGTLPGSLRKY
jgi:hypothetical protein